MDYIVYIVLGGVVYRSQPMSLAQCKQAVEAAKLAAPNTAPKVLFNHTA